MQCSLCRAEIPTNVAYCPVCGNPISSSAQSVDQSTIVSSPGGSQPIYPSTNYGSLSYQGLQENPYNNPYEQPSPYAIGLPQPPRPVIGSGTSLPVPSPIPSPRPNRTRIFLIVGICVLVLALIVVSMNLFALSSRGRAGSETPTMPSYLPYKGTLALDDPLQDNSKGYNWQEISDSSGDSCSFAQGAYHAIQERPSGQTGAYYYTCVAESSNFDNFVYQVQMKIVQGDCGGLIFRGEPSNSQFYYFRVCTDGSYTLYIYKNAQGTLSPIGPLSSVSVHTGLNKGNLIAIAAKGNAIDFYINQKKVDSITDSTYSKGQIALAAEIRTSDLTEVIYSNAKVWTL